MECRRPERHNLATISDLRGTGISILAAQNRQVERRRDFAPKSLGKTHKKQQRGPSTTIGARELGIGPESGRQKFLESRVWGAAECGCSKHRESTLNSTRNRGMRLRTPETGESTSKTDPPKTGGLPLENHTNPYETAYEILGMNADARNPYFQKVQGSSSGASPVNGRLAYLRSHPSLKHRSLPNATRYQPNPKAQGERDTS